MGSIQLHLYAADELKKDRVLLKVENLFSDRYKDAQISDRVRKMLLAQYSDLNLVVNTDLVLDFEVEILDKSQLTFSASTGKLRNVIDHRN